jgi:hypothetical protein
MIALVFLGLFFVVVASAVIFGWGVDSRDSRFSLWPLYPTTPNESRRGDAKRPDAPRSAASPRRRTKTSATVPEGLDTAHGPVPRSAPRRRPVHRAHQTVLCRREGGPAVKAASPTRPGAKADRS